jgi:hypothetical protein
MKLDQLVTDLLKYHFDKDELNFRKTAMQIAEVYSAENKGSIASLIYHFLYKEIAWLPKQPRKRVKT